MTQCAKTMREFLSSVKEAMFCNGMFVYIQISKLLPGNVMLYILAKLHVLRNFFFSENVM